MIRFIRSSIRRPASKFRGELELLDGSLKELLTECLKMTARLGGGRRRGDGLVKITPLEPIPVNPLKKLAAPESLEKLNLRLVLRNLDPVCLPLTGSPDNIIPSECYIRGQAVLGMFAGWAVNSGSIQLSADSMKIEEIFSNKIAFSNAYTLPGLLTDYGKKIDVSGLEAAPFPLNIQIPKQGGGEAEANDPWWARDDNVFQCVDRFTVTEEEMRKYGKLKRPKDDWFLFRFKDQNSGEPARWSKFSPLLGIHMRHQAPQNRGKDNTQLFSEEEIAEDTLFVTDIGFHDLDAARKFFSIFEDVLNGRRWLTAGRGGRPVEVAHAAWTPFQNQGTFARGNNNIGNRGRLTLTLQSDLIARGPTLGFYDKLDPDALCYLLGMDNNFSSLQVEKSFIDTVEVRGFNASSGLRRPAVLALRRGSAVLIKGNGAEIEELREALAGRIKTRQWLGERTREGFGRFLLDFNPAPDLNNPIESGGPGDADADSSKNDHIARTEAVLRKSRELADSLKKAKDGPSKSQWRYLQSRAKAAKNNKEIKRLLGEIKENSKKSSGKPWLVFLEKEGAVYANAYRDFKERQLFLTSLVDWLI